MDIAHLQICSYSKKHHHIAPHSYSDNTNSSRREVHYPTHLSSVSRTGMSRRSWPLLILVLIIPDPFLSLAPIPPHAIATRPRITWTPGFGAFRLGSRSMRIPLSMLDLPFFSLAISHSLRPQVMRADENS
jgi:hypothetical protein